MLGHFCILIQTFFLIFIFMIKKYFIRQLRRSDHCAIAKIQNYRLPKILQATRLIFFVSLELWQPKLFIRYLETGQWRKKFLFKIIVTFCCLTWWKVLKRKRACLWHLCAFDVDAAAYLTDWKSAALKFITLVCTWPEGSCSKLT